MIIPTIRLSNDCWICTDGKSVATTAAAASTMRLVSTTAAEAMIRQFRLESLTTTAAEPKIRLLQPLLLMLHQRLDCEATMLHR